MGREKLDMMVDDVDDEKQYFAKVDLRREATQVAV